MIEEKVLLWPVCRVGLGFLSQQAIAQQTTADCPRIQRGEITSSAIKRAESEIALPTTVIAHAELERTEAASAQDLDNLILSNFGDWVLTQNTDATGNPSTANLRRLGPQYTLALLNGRLVANYAFASSPVDLNSIPLSAIDRIEVLRDGASATNGAGAVAGVINFILRKDDQCAEVSPFDSKVQQGGGNSRNLNFIGGFGDIATPCYNVLVSASHETDRVLTAVERSFASTWGRPYLGLIKTSPRNDIANFNFTDSTGVSYGTVNSFRHNICDAATFAFMPIGSATQCPAKHRASFLFAARTSFRDRGETRAAPPPAGSPVNHRACRVRQRIAALGGGRARSGLPKWAPGLRWRQLPGPHQGPAWAGVASVGPRSSRQDVGGRLIIVDTAAKT